METELDDDGGIIDTSLMRHMKGQEIASPGHHHYASTLVSYLRIIQHLHYSLVILLLAIYQGPKSTVCDNVFLNTGR